MIFITYKYCKFSESRGEMFLPKFKYNEVHKLQNLFHSLTSHELTPKENATIKCRSLNTSPEYEDFELSLNDVTGLFNIIDVSWKPSDG